MFTTPLWELEVRLKFSRELHWYMRTYNFFEAWERKHFWDSNPTVDVTLSRFPPLPIGG